MGSRFGEWLAWDGMRLAHFVPITDDRIIGRSLCGISLPLVHDHPVQLPRCARCERQLQQAAAPPAKGGGAHAA
jgi:hypothetical protein